MKASDSDLIDRAKRDIDLASFLGANGFTPMGNDDPRWRVLTGPGDRRVLIHRAKTGDWLWRDANGEQAGNIYHACTELLNLPHGRALGMIRNAAKNPPPALPVRRGTHRFESANIQAPHDSRPKPPRTLYPMTTENSEFLDRLRCLTPEMVAPFAHQLRSTHMGDLIAPHNSEGDGEEYRPQADGSTLKRFTGGSRDDGPGRGRSVWYADPEFVDVVRVILVADSVPDAIAAAAKLDPETRVCTRIVSTAGDLSEAGKLKLTRLIEEAKQDCVRSGGGKLVLVDASDLGEQKTKSRETTFRQLAADTGALYERWAPAGYKDWNDVVIAERRAQAATRSANTELADPVTETGTTEAVDEPRKGRRSR